MEQMNNSSPTAEKEDHVTKISHTTCIKVKPYDFEWKIKNLQHWHENDDTCEFFLESPEFHTIDTKKNKIEWTLELFPRGFENEEDAKNYVEVRLCMCDTVENYSFTEVDAQISLVDKDGLEANVQKKTFTKDEISDYEAFFYKFVYRDMLFGNRGFETTAFTPNNEVTILCRLFFNQGYYHTAIPTKRRRSGQIEEIPAKRRLVEFDDFEQLYKSPNFSDVMLIVGSKEFSAHKNILSARSSVFANMFEAKNSEQVENRIEINDVDANVLEELLRFIYVGKVDNVQKLGRELLIAAEKYKLEGLQAICEQVLLDDLNENNIADILVLINSCCSARKLKTAATDFLTKNAKVLVNSEEFKTILHSLSPALLTEVINALMLKL